MPRRGPASRLGSARCRAAAAVVWAAALLTACAVPAADESAPREPGVAPAGGSARGMNVVFVTVDSVRARSLPTYGYDRDTMPTVDAWAADAVVFPPMHAVSAWTFPGLASMFTGRYPAGHAVDARGRELAEVATLQGLLADAGYRVPTLSHLLDIPGMRGFAQENARWVDPATERGGALMEWLASAEAQDGPFFAWDHWRGSHLPYDPPPPHDTMFGAGVASPAAQQVRDFLVIPAEIQAFGPDDRDPIVRQYDAALHWMDARWGELLETLEASGLADRTVVVFTADHGEELLEHGLVGHASTTLFGRLYEEILRIPFIVRVPGSTLAPPGCAVSQIDVMPTLLGLLGLPVPAALDGQNLARQLGGEPCAERPLFAESIQGGFQSRGSSARTFLWSVSDGPDKLIVTRDETSETVELYDLASDPDEVENTADANPETVSRLQALLDEFIVRAGGPDYWKGREESNVGPRRRHATAVIAAPRILDPPVGAALDFAATDGQIVGTWSGSPVADYVIEYDVGEGINRTQGTFEVRGTRYEFGPVPPEVWDNLSQFNPWRLRLWPKLDPDLKSPWASFRVLPIPE